MGVEKTQPIAYFADANNFYEVQRKASDSSYFFDSIDSEVTSPSVLVLAEGLTGFELQHNIVYCDAMKDFLNCYVGECSLSLKDELLKRPSNEILQKTINNWMMGMKNDVATLSHDDPSFAAKATRYVDCLLVLGYHDEARNSAKELRVGHDIIRVIELAEKNNWSFPSALSSWAALCRWPLSRSIARLVVSDMTCLDTIQAHLAGYADFISLQDAFVLSAVRLTFEHPLTSRLFDKWKCELAVNGRVAASVIPLTVHDIINMRDKLSENLCDANTCLLTVYRLSVCCLPAEERTKMQMKAKSHGILRRIWLAALATNEWACADVMASDIASRCENSLYVKDAFKLMGAVAQLVSTFDRCSPKKMTDLMTSLRTTGGLNSLLAPEVVGANNSILRSPCYESGGGVDDETVETQSSIDGIFRFMRNAIRKLNFGEDLDCRVAVCIHLSWMMSKILLDEERSIGERLVPCDSSEPYVVKLSTEERKNLFLFLRRDVGNLFAHAHQRDRYGEALKHSMDSKALEQELFHSKSTTGSSAQSSASTPVPTNEMFNTCAQSAVLNAAPVSKCEEFPQNGDTSTMSVCGTLSPEDADNINLAELTVETGAIMNNSLADSTMEDGVAVTQSRCLHEGVIEKQSPIEAAREPVAREVTKEPAASESVGAHVAEEIIVQGFMAQGVADFSDDGWGTLRQAYEDKVAVHDAPATAEPEKPPLETTTLTNPNIVDWDECSSRNFGDFPSRFCSTLHLNSTFEGSRAPSRSQMLVDSTPSPISGTPSDTPKKVANVSEDRRTLTSLASIDTSESVQAESSIAPGDSAVSKRDHETREQGGEQAPCTEILHAVNGDASMEAGCTEDSEIILPSAQQENVSAAPVVAGTDDGPIDAIGATPPLTPKSENKEIQSTHRQELTEKTAATDSSATFSGPPEMLQTGWGDMTSFQNGFGCGVASFGSSTGAGDAGFGNPQQGSGFQEQRRGRGGGYGRGTGGGRGATGFSSNRGGFNRDRRGSNF